MNRPVLLMLALLMCAGSGCAICSNAYDCYYPAYGGLRPRGNMTHGRVGSAFNDASANVPASAVVPAPGAETPTGPELLPAMPGDAGGPELSNEAFDPWAAGGAPTGEPTPAIPNLLDSASDGGQPGDFVVQLVSALEAVADTPQQPLAGGADPDAPFDFTAP